MITFYTRSQPYIYTTLLGAIAALERGVIRDDIISAELKGNNGIHWLHLHNENEAEYRVRIVKDLKAFVEPMKLDQPILVQEQCSYVRTYKRLITGQALRELIVTMYDLPKDTTLLWHDQDSGVKVEAHYTVTSTGGSNATPPM